LSDAALAERAYALADRIRRMSCQLWTDPERFFLDRSELAAEAYAIASRIAPDQPRAPRVRVAISGEARGRVEVLSQVINGKRVTVQRRRRPFAISVGK